MDSAAAAAGEKPKAKRGRKQDNTLPPSRSRDMQRAFRARKAEHLAQLEAKVVRLEQENNELRAKLGMVPRPPTPPPSAEGGANPTAVPSPSESASSQNHKVDEPATPSDVGAGVGRPSSSTTSPVASASPVWRPTPMEPPLPPQQQLPSPINFASHPNGGPAQWEGPAGYPRPPQPPQHDLAMLASLATHPHPRPYPPSSGPYPPPLHPSAYENHQPYAQAPYPPHSALAYPPSQASPSFPYPTNRLPPMSVHHGSPTDTTPSPFRPSHQSSFTRSEPLSTPTPPANPCQPDSRACPPSACVPASGSCGPAKSSCGPASKGYGPSSGECGPPKPASACLAPPAARGPLPPINSIIDTLPDLDLSPLAALGTYIRPTPLRPPTPDPTLADRFLDTYCTRPTTSAADSVHPPFASPSSPYRTFLLTLLHGLELTGKGPCERESFTPEEEMQLNTPAGEECCGGIVDCTGSLFEEQIFYEENGRPRMKDGWISCSDAWEALVEFCEEDGVQVKEEEGAEVERDSKRQRFSLDNGSSSGRHSPSFLAHALLESMSPTSTFASSGRVDTLVSRNVRCEAAYGLMVKDTAVSGVKCELEAQARGETRGADGGDGSVKVEPQHHSMPSQFQPPPPYHTPPSNYPPLQQTNGCGPAANKGCC